MASLRTGLGLVGALVPVLYCGGLVWYFTDLGGWGDPFVSEQLRPTIIGLSIVGLLCAIGFGFKLNRAFASRRPGAGGEPPPGPPRSGDGDNGDSDADAMIARYLAQRAASDPAAAIPARRPGPVKASVSFGRRQRS